MSTTNDVKKRALEIGAKFIPISTKVKEFEVEVEAPSGHVFRGTDVHSLVGCREDDDTVANVCAGLLERMAEGVTACHIQDCDFCNDEA